MKVLFSLFMIIVGASSRAAVNRSVTISSPEDVQNNKQTLPVNVSAFTSNIAVGGAGSPAFYFGVMENKLPQSGTVIRSLKVWYYNDGVYGLEVGLSNGTIYSRGSKYHQISEMFVIEDGETITSLKLWATKNSYRCGGLEVITNQNRKFSIDAGRYGNYYQPELGSGILIGAFGRAYNAINCLGFALLRRASAHLIGVEYPDVSTQLIATEPSEVDTITYKNEGPEEQEFTFGGTVTVTTEQSWSITASLEAGISIEVEAGIPIIDEAKVKASLKVTIAGSYSRKNTKTYQKTYNFPLKVPGNTSLQASAVLYEGNINTRYAGMVVYTLDTGAKFAYNVSGEYKGVSASEVVIDNHPVSN